MEGDVPVYRVTMDGKPEYDSLDNYTVLTGTSTRRRIEDRRPAVLPNASAPRAEA